MRLAGAAVGMGPDIRCSGPAAIGVVRRRDDGRPPHHVDANALLGNLSRGPEGEGVDAGFRGAIRDEVLDAVSAWGGPPGMAVGET